MEHKSVVSYKKVFSLCMNRGNTGEQALKKIVLADIENSLEE